jgi:thioredoxin reductase
LYNTEVKEILGEKSVEGIKVFSNKTNEEKTLKQFRMILKRRLTRKGI